MSQIICNQSTIILLPYVSPIVAQFSQMSTANKFALVLYQSIFIYSANFLSSLTSANEYT